MIFRVVVMKTGMTIFGIVRFSGNGYSGTATTRQCYRFGSNSYVDVTMTIEDLTESKSNRLDSRERQNLQELTEL